MSNLVKIQQKQVTQKAIKIRRNIDVQYRKKAIEDLIKTQSEYSNIYEKNGEKIIIRICRI